MTNTAHTTAAAIAKARTMSLTALTFTIRDIQATLDLWIDRPTSDPYVAKLLAEFDVYTTARQQRLR